MLLLEDYTAAFLPDKSIAFVDSRALPTTPATCRPGRSGARGRDLWIDARRGVLRSNSAR